MKNKSSERSLQYLIHLEILYHHQLLFRIEKAGMPGAKTQLKTFPEKFLIKLKRKPHKRQKLRTHLFKAFKGGRKSPSSSVERSFFTRMAPIRQIAILAPLLFFLIGRNSAGIIAAAEGGDDDSDFGARDICDPDQELVLASFGGCGCCIRTSSYKVGLSLSICLGLGLIRWHIINILVALLIECIL